MLCGPDDVVFVVNDFILLKFRGMKQKIIVPKQPSTHTCQKNLGRRPVLNTMFVWIECLFVWIEWCR